MEYREGGILMKISIDALKELEELKKHYDDTLANLKKAADNSERAYGGYVRAFKGELVEYMAKQLVIIAWTKILNQNINRLDINKTKLPVYMTNRYNYLDRVKEPKVKKWLIDNQKDQIYKFGTDVQVFIDGKLVLPIECKAFSENAMLKRILFDAELMNETAGCKTYYLLQLESQLGGDYSQLNPITYGSPATNALLSHSKIDLVIITLLKGERKVDKPIHEPKYFKELNIEQLIKAVLIFSEALTPYVR